MTPFDGIPWVAIAECLIALAIAVWRLSWPALIGAVAVAVTIGLRYSPFEFVSSASAVWVLAGLFLFMFHQWLPGALYCLSGLAYLLILTGLKDIPYAPVHFISDPPFLIALVILAWPNTGRHVRGGRRHNRHSSLFFGKVQNLARFAKVDRY